MMRRYNRLLVAYYIASDAVLFTTTIQSILMASLLAWLVAVASPARGQPTSCRSRGEAGGSVDLFR